MLSGEDHAFTPTVGMVRKLAAILSADVEGYSRLMGEDEEATIHTLTVYQAVIGTLVQQHRGRVVDSPGDNLLAEFASVVDAVQCGVAIQQELNVRNTALPVQRRMRFRLGINLGDVIADRDRIYGDGVNIAARLESLAEGGGICISGTVYDQVATKLALGYEDLGKQEVKNIARAVRVYRVRLAPGSPAPTASEHAGTSVVGAERALAVRGGPIRSGPRWSWPRSAFTVVGLLLLLGGGITIWQRAFSPSSPTPVVPVKQAPAPAVPDKPSIAVLPFVNMSGESAQEYFSDGMTEDLITDLSRLAGLFVIARNSVFTYKGKVVKPDQVSQELGVRYVLEGSVRKANDRVRITAQLIDATTGYHLWAERYDRDLHDIFAVQEEIARRITKALAVRLTSEEIENMGQPYTNNVKAWEYFMQGAELYRRVTKEANAGARVLFEKAIAEDKNFARAYALWSGTYRQDWLFGWTQELDTADQKALELAERARTLANQEPEPKPSLPYALQQLAYVYMYRMDHDKAIEVAKEAVDRDRNYADGYSAWALALIYSVESAEQDQQQKVTEAIGKMEIAMRLNPKYPATYPFHLGQAHYVLGVLNSNREEYGKAEKHLLEALGSNPKYRPARAYLVAVYIAEGLEEKAKEEMAKLVNMGRPQSLYSVKQRVAPYRNDTVSSGLLAAWQKAGGG
jgi:adenylate cyclase